jgi:molybdopterin/thiamine biosynthesis adenylyltransferase
MKEPFNIIKSFIEEGVSPSGRVYSKISFKAVQLAALQLSCSIKEVEITALENGVVPERYERSLGTIGGAEGQIVLLKSRAAVVGLGGLGGFASELWARMGVGTLVLIDGDSFSESNLNRQLLATEENIGQSKAEAARQRIKLINAAVETVVHKEMAIKENIGFMLRGCNVVLDCLDNLQTRFLLQDSCQQLGIPLVHGAIAQFFGQVSTIMPGDPGFKAIYKFYEKGKDKGIERELGNPSTTPALVSAWQVQEAIKVLLSNEATLRNRLLFIDTLHGGTETILLNEDEKNDE